MEWSRNILRKVISFDEKEAEISHDRCIIHSKKLELISTSIQETGIPISRMAGEENQCINETLLRDLGMNISYRQNAGSLASDEDFGIFQTVNSNEEKMAAGDECRMPRSTEEAVYFDDNSSFLKSRLDNSSDGNENNANIASEKYELDCVNEDKEKDVGDNGRSLQTADIFENIDFSVIKLSNFPNHIENNNQTSKNIDNISQNKVFKSPKSFKKFKIKQIPKFQNLSRKRKNHCTNGNFAGTNVEPKIDNSHAGETCSIFFTNKPSNEKNIAKYESEVNVFSKSNASKIPVLSKNMTRRNNDDDDSKRTEDELMMKVFHNQKDILSNRNDIKNNAKKCDSSVTHFENEMRRRKLDKETASKSVTDLITYFESLELLKQSNAKSKVKKIESKKGLKNDRIIKVNRIINSNIPSLPSTLRISKVGPKADKVKESIQDYILSEVISNDTKEPVAEKSEIILHHVNSGDRKRPIEVIQENDLLEINLCDRKRSNDEKSPEVNVLDLKTGVRKKSIQTIPDKIQSDFNTHRCENMASSAAKLGMCAYREGKCGHCEKAINNAEDNANKEHGFVFSDDIPKRTQPSIISRRLRSRFTSNHNPVFLQPFRELDVKPTSDFNKTEKNGGFLIDNSSETAVKISLSDGRVNKLSLKQNSNDVTREKTRRKEKYQENLSDKRKLKLSSSSEGSSKVKCFIGFLLTAVIFAIIYKGVFENYFVD